MANPLPPGRQPAVRPNTADPMGLGTRLLTGGRDWWREKTSPIVEAAKRASDPGDYLNGNLLNAIQPPPPARPPRINTGDTTVVLIGGAGDGYTISDDDVGHDYAHQFSNKKFFTHLQAKFAREAVLPSIEERAHGRPIILIGHSWGGPQAYELARDLTDRGNAVVGLFTADPVSRNPSGPRPKTIWVNVAAASRSRNASDEVASIGGKPSRLPTQLADISAVAAGHHEGLEDMMRQRLNNGISAEDQIKALVKAASKAQPSGEMPGSTQF